MTDHTAGSGGPASGPTHRAPRAEFVVYFAVIFLVAIPFAALAWLVQAATEQRLPSHGPLARAWREAGAITPAIFRP
jgi:hypothetical protein